MIEHLSGTLLHKEDDHIVIDVAGAGYGVDITERTAAALGPVNSEVRLWVYTYVREDTLNLFGFLTRGEREVFETMLSIGGVGPKLSLAILASFTIDRLIQVIMTGNATALKNVPGIGAKKAERLLMDLKERVKRLTAGIEPARLAELGSQSQGEFQPKSSNARDAVAALEALDLTGSSARRAIAKALELLGPDAAAEALVREGLRHRHG